MFRNPRENAQRNTTSRLQPSIGRPPSPPASSPRLLPAATSGTTTITLATATTSGDFSSKSINSSSQESVPMAVATRAAPARRASGTSKQQQPALPTIGRGSTNPKKSQTSAAAKNRTPGKPNASILNFFKKTDEDQLFVTDLYGGGLGDKNRKGRSLGSGSGVEERDAVVLPVLNGEEDVSRFNEEGGSIKRRKMDSPGAIDGTGVEVATTKPQPAIKKVAAPFVEESDSDSDDEGEIVFCAATKQDSTPESPSLKEISTPGEGPISDQEAAPKVPSISREASVTEEAPTSALPTTDSTSSTILPTPERQSTPKSASLTTEKASALVSAFAAAPLTPEAIVKSEPVEVDIQQINHISPKPPTLTHEATSASILLGDDDQFADFEGLQDDFDEDLFEDGEEFVERRYLAEQRRLEMDETGAEDDSFDMDTVTIKKEPESQQEAASCPLCSICLDGISESDASTHVNNCLDGNPTPLPEKKKPATPISEGAARFKRPPRPPKPGQENPFAAEGKAAGSAFSKLMSSHAEDAAWAAASAAENASRGKPAYTRTCPFYKIMPGMNICVDAFRYGAVKGCNAYFLSHFHSDHYIGLTSTWTHGPIYCSKVTANLVKQQLRVDPQYVIPMEWEDPIEIPGTNGVITTMISANHCPGSSLYLFEKTLPGHTMQKPKLHRVLHCGDFRACPAHIEHPLLMPDILDSVTKKTRQQKIDVCYLDTTYLNPKYAFPDQIQVIQACADMCVSLNKVNPDETDGWETMKRARAGEGMVKFVRKDSNPVIKVEPTDDMKVMSNGKLGNEKTRGRLLVVVGTYSIGKERICLGIAHALQSKIYAPTGKMRIVKALEDPELMALMTSNPREAQVHMTPLFEIRADTLDEYLAEYSDSFTRCVGFRPSGWQYRPPNSRFVESPAVQTVLHSPNWRSNFSMKELVPQRGSTSRASCFGVPYSEHSSFRELTMFCCALRVEKVVPTVNVGSAKSREKMGVWIERWQVERKKNGLFRLGEGTEW